MRIDVEEFAVFPSHLENAEALITAFYFPSESYTVELYDLSAWLFYDAKEDKDARFVSEKIGEKFVQVLELTYDVATARALTRSDGPNARPIAFVNGDDVRRAAKARRPEGD